MIADKFHDSHVTVAKTKTMFCLVASAGNLDSITDVALPSQLVNITEQLVEVYKSIEITATSYSTMNFTPPCLDMVSFAWYRKVEKSRTQIEEQSQYLTAYIHNFLSDFLLTALKILRDINSDDLENKLELISFLKQFSEISHIPAGSFTKAFSPNRYKVAHFPDVVEIQRATTKSNPAELVEIIRWCETTIDEDMVNEITRIISDVQKITVVGFDEVIETLLQRLMLLREFIAQHNADKIALTENLAFFHEKLCEFISKVPSVSHYERIEAHYNRVTDSISSTSGELTRAHKNFDNIIEQLYAAFMDYADAAEKRTFTVARFDSTVHA